MNFNHFTEMPDGELENETFQELCHDLLRRSAGLQLRPTQKRYNILLPIYFGKPDEPSRTENCWGILVQVKNRADNKTSPSNVFNLQFEREVPVRQSTRPATIKTKKTVGGSDPYIVPINDFPFLCLLIDLRAPNREVEVYHAISGPRDDAYVIHSRGHDSSIFPCIGNLKCNSGMEDLLSTTLMVPISPQKTILTHNARVRVPNRLDVDG
jgi:hypothetical protein